MTPKPRGRPRLDKTNRRTPMELALTPRERGMAHALSGGYQTSVMLRNLILTTYEDARRDAQANAAKFLRLSSSGHNPRQWASACIRAECGQAEVWDILRAVATTGDLTVLRVTLQLQVGAWCAVLPAAFESYVERPKRASPDLHGHPTVVISLNSEHPTTRTPTDAKDDPQPGDKRYFASRQLSNGPVIWTVRVRDADLLEVDVDSPTSMLPHYVARGVALDDWQGRSPGQKDPSSYHPSDGVYRGPEAA